MPEHHGCEGACVVDVVHQYRAVGSEVFEHRGMGLPDGIANGEVDWTSSLNSGQ